MLLQRLETKEKIPEEREAHNGCLLSLCKNMSHGLGWLPTTHVQFGTQISSWKS